MSLTLLVWLTAFVVMTLLALHRPSWGVASYMLTYFACPQFWWWGRPIADYRWNLYAGIVLLIVVLCFGKSSVDRTTIRVKRGIACIAVAMVLNMTMVHFLLAEDLEISALYYSNAIKLILLYFLIVAAVRNENDLRIVLLSVLLGAGYIGYECTVNHRGHIENGRLEGVGASGAVGANELAALMVAALPIAAVFFLAGRRWEKVLALVLAPCILNVVLLCDSRGAFLGSVASGGAFLVAAPKLIRKQAVITLALGAIATWMLMGDERIVERFYTIFVGEEQRDGSATSRLTYWNAGIEVIRDHPFGTGGQGFNRVHGPRYLADEGLFFQSRSVHNGFINEACEWGVQGFFLRILLILSGIVVLWQSIRSVGRTQDHFGSVAGCALLAGTVGFLVTCCFGDLIDNDWSYWLVAFSVCHSQIFGLNGLTDCAPNPTYDVKQGCERKLPVLRGSTWAGISSTTVEG